MKVKVREDLQENFVGFYNHARRRPGDVFRIADNPRRDLFPKERQAVSEDAQTKAVYDAIKDADGKIARGFSFKWMTPVSEATPTKVSTSPEVLKEKHDKTLLERMAGKKAEGADGADGAEDEERTQPVAGAEFHDEVI